MANQKIIEGHKPGVRFHTTAGWFTNGTTPRPEVAAELEKQGYKLRAVDSPAEMASDQIGENDIPVKGASDRGWVEPERNQAARVEAE